MDSELSTDTKTSRAEWGTIVARVALAVVVLIYLAIGIGYNIKVPKWNAPDEPAHYNYIRQLAEGRGLPVLTAADWNVDYQNKLISAHFPDEFSIDPIRYENWQPPLYYILATPFYAATSGLGITIQVFALRLYSTLLGALLLLVVYATARVIFPRDRWLPVMATAFVAFVPMYGAINASISNDALANLILSIIVLLVAILTNPLKHDSKQQNRIVRWLTSGWWQGPLILGIVMGIGFVTKSTTYLGLGLIALCVIISTPWPWLPQWRGILRSLLISYIVALAIGGWWFVRNAIVYGHFDFMGSRNHELVVVGQTKTGIFDWAAFGNLLQTSFRSFWAQFGWMGIPADQRTFNIIIAVCVLVVMGLLVFCIRAVLRKTSLSAYQWKMLGVLALTALAAFGAFVGYNLSFLQVQGRYLFPAMVAFGTIASFSLGQLAPRRFVPVLYTLVTAVLLFVDIWCLFKVVANAFGT